MERGSKRVQKLFVFISFSNNLVLSMYHGTVLMKERSFDSTSFLTYGLHHLKFFIKDMEEFFCFFEISDECKESFFEIGNIPLPHRTGNWIHRHFIIRYAEMLLGSQ